MTRQFLSSIYAGFLQKSVNFLGKICRILQNSSKKTHFNLLLFLWQASEKNCLSRKVFTSFQKKISRLQCSGSRDKTSFFLTSFWWKLKYYKAWYLIYNTILTLINFDTKMSLNNMEKVVTSFPDVQSI